MDGHQTCLMRVQCGALGEAHAWLRQIRTMLCFNHSTACDLRAKCACRDQHVDATTAQRKAKRTLFICALTQSATSVVRNLGRPPLAVDIHALGREGRRRPETVVRRDGLAVTRREHAPAQPPRQQHLQALVQPRQLRDLSR
eukprot:4465625-Prymnesium_polylepis.1